MSAECIFQQLPDTEKHGNLFRNMSPSLTKSISTTNQVRIMIVPEKLTIELVKADYRQFELHELLQRQSNFFTMLISFNKGRAPISFTVFCLIGNHVKSPIEAANERQQHQDSETSTNP